MAEFTNKMSVAFTAFFFFFSPFGLGHSEFVPRLRSVLLRPVGAPPSVLLLAVTGLTT